jgi:hypothetical protein
VVIAGRPRIGAGAAQSDLEQSAGINERDRAAARADCMDVETRSSVKAHTSASARSGEECAPPRPALAGLVESRG